MPVLMRKMDGWPVFQNLISLGLLKSLSCKSGAELVGFLIFDALFKLNGNQTRSAFKGHKLPRRP